MSAAGLTPQEVNNFAHLEDHLVALLKRAVQGMSPAVHVLTTADLVGVQEEAQFVPALHVVGNGFAVVEAQYRAMRLRHVWYVVAVVRNAASQRRTDAARRDAGALQTRAMAALLSEPLPGAATPLTPTAAPAGVPSKKGYYYLPSGWQVESVFRKP